MVAVALSLLLTQAPKPLAEMDFDFYNHMIHIPVLIGGHKTEAILDTGAASAVMDLALADQWKLKETGDIVSGGIGKDRVSGKFLTDTKASVGGIETPIHVAIPLEPLSHMSGRPLPVVLGYELLSRCVVEVDYPHRHIRFFDPTTDRSGAGTAVPIRLEGNHIHMTSQLAIGGTNYQVETVVDTGAGGCGGLTAKFLALHPLNVVRTPSAVIGGGVGGLATGRLFRPDSVEVAGHSFSTPVLSLSESSGGASGPNSTYDFLLGALVLSRFKLTIDYPHKRLIFEPGTEMEKPFEADKTGLRIVADGPNLRVFRVAGILPGSSSEAAGVKVDDVIESVDGKQAGSMELQDLRALFASAGTQAWNLEVRRGGQRLKIKVPAKSVI